MPSLTTAKTGNCRHIWALTIAVSETVIRATIAAIAVAVAVIVVAVVVVVSRRSASSHFPRRLPLLFLLSFELFCEFHFVVDSSILGLDRLGMPLQTLRTSRTETF